MAVKNRLLAALLIFISAGVNAQRSSVSSMLDSEEYQIGDYINLQINIESEEELSEIRAVFIDSLKGARFLKEVPFENYKVKDRPDKFFYRGGFILSKYDSGLVVTPPALVAFQFKQSGKLDTLYVQSHSALVNIVNVDQRAEIKDVKPPERIPLDWRYVALWILAVTVFLAIIGFIVYYFHKKKKNKINGGPEVYKSPSEIALESLLALEEKKLWQKGMIKQYHTEITEIIRRYYETKYEIPAMESTTSELIYTLNNSSVPKDAIETTNKFLNNADLVKFAKYVPMNSINEEMMRQAYKIIELTASEEDSEKSVESEAGDV